MENFKILEEKENPLFNRKEVKFSIDAQVTPSNADVEKFISEKFSAQPEAIEIKGIHGGFGSKTFTISANIYKTGEDLEKTEPKQKEKVKTEEKAVEVPKEEVKEESEKTSNDKIPNVEGGKVEKDSPDKDKVKEESDIDKQSESKVSK